MTWFVNRRFCVSTCMRKTISIIAPYSWQIIEGIIGRTKHILLNYHFIRENVAESIIFLKKIYTFENPTHMFTKYVPREKFKLCLDLIHVTQHWRVKTTHSDSGCRDIPFSEAWEIKDIPNYSFRSCSSTESKQMWRFLGIYLVLLS